MLAASTLTACGGGSGDDPDTVKVSYKQSMDNQIRVMDTYLESMKKQFEKANPGKKVKLVPIKAPDAEYYTKVQQMLRSPKTAPDLVYEDTFLINSDITSGYLKPLDPYLNKWKEWPKFIDTAKAAAKAEDGKTYGVPDGRRAGRHGHARALVRPGHLQEGGPAAGLAAEELGRAARRGPHHQEEGAGRRPAERLHGQARR
ncbi:putative ABC transporter extracellular-binding protein YurO [Streptomyces aurantiacus JA 4570]|uniref:Putative ABC transporter extracellular-binding protein YurO n=1 Tax=Streptomyces aurantiacus JA 4570 TaxID=1286094 RepID=S3ZLQ5_9ACTN|nr:putative ABC transporter extracellular-binding protein YurO [Streptomyces aurantiacus JA 4570]